MDERTVPGPEITETDHPANDDPPAQPAPPPPWTYWVVPGRFLAGCFPGHLDPAEETRRIGLLLDAGVRTWVNLMEEAETNHAGQRFAPYAERVTAAADRRGLAAQCHRFPIRDLDIPSRAEMERILDGIDTALQTGPVYLHCWGGVGRTGTVVGCWLLRHGLATPDNVFERISELRRMDRERGHRRSPETPAQHEFVRCWTKAPGG